MSPGSLLGKGAGHQAGTELGIGELSPRLSRVPSDLYLHIPCLHGPLGCQHVPCPVPKQSPLQGLASSGQRHLIRCGVPYGSGLTAAPGLGCGGSRGEQ